SSFSGRWRATWWSTNASSEAPHFSVVQIPLSTLPPMMTLGRRAFTLGVLTSLAAACTRGGANAPLHEDVERQLAELERSVGGRVGVLAVETGSGARVARRSNERFAMCSTFKIVLVAALLSLVERGEASLDERVPFSAADLVEHADVTTAHIAEGAMSLGDL